MGIKLTEPALVNFNQGNNPKKFQFPGNGTTRIDELEMKFQPIRIDENATLLIIAEGKIISMAIPCINSSISFEVQSYILPQFKSLNVNSVEVKLTSQVIRTRSWSCFLREK